MKKSFFFITQKFLYLPYLSRRFIVFSLLRFWALFGQQEFGRAPGIIDLCTGTVPPSEVAVKTMRKVFIMRKIVFAVKTPK
jgi:hypothetical protein